MIYKKLNRDIIKYIAMFTMLLNHIANIFLNPGTFLFTFLVDIGYFTAPVMCWFLVEGYHYTHSKIRYGARLALFAVISEFPFCLAFSEVYNGEHIISFCGFNMIFTLFLCFCILLAEEYFLNRSLSFICIIILIIISLFSDWALIAPVFTLMFSHARGDRVRTKKAFLTGALIFAIMNLNPGYSGNTFFTSLALAVFSSCGILAAGFVIIHMYNGKRISGWRTFSKWFFYLFYPAHLMVLGLIRIFIFS